MKSFLAVATILFACAPAAFAQETPAVSPAAPVATASLETPVAAPVVSPVAPTLPAVSASPPSMATGWTGPVNFAPVGVIDMLARVCRQSVSGDGGNLTTQATKLGLGSGQAAPEDLARVMPGNAVSWRTPSADGELYLMGYGEDPMKCGAAVVRPIPEVGFSKVVELLKAPALGFATDAAQTLAGNVRWERLKSPGGEFIDLMEYPASGESPGVLRADYLEE